MEVQKEALNRIIGTVKSKYGEAEEFARVLEMDLGAMNTSYNDSISDLNGQFRLLTDCLENARIRMISAIESEHKMKEKPLRDRLKSFEDAKKDAEDLITMSSIALATTSQVEFSNAALRIKDRVTMSPIFRISLSPIELDCNSYFVVDFSREQRIISQLKFLPVPKQPEIIESGCYVEDNIVHCMWSIPEEDDHLIAMDSEYNDIPVSLYSEPTARLPASVDYFLLQFRQIDNEAEDGPWTTLENIRQFQHDIEGLSFHHNCLEFRVQAWNKALGGTWSNSYVIPTPAFNFSFNPEACHPSVKVVYQDKVEWDPTATRVQETRLRSAGQNRSTSPVKGAGNGSPRKIKTKERFTGESYTVLGDTPFTEEESYFEVEPHPDCKTYSVGIASKSLARFDQVGRTSTSWALHVSNWIQNSFVAKHNNKVKNLESTADIPSRIGVYFNSSAGILSFYNAESRHLIHTFKQVKFTGPLVPGFLIWFGSLQIFTGIQIPSWIVTRSSTSMTLRTESGIESNGNSPKNISPEN